MNALVESWATRDLDTGNTASCCGSAYFRTASIVKVNISIALYLRAQDELRDVTDEEASLIHKMIRASDNESTHVAWRMIGAAEGLGEVNARLGLDATVGGPGERWGLTSTTALDQLKLLGHVFTEESEVIPYFRAILRQHMSLVNADQRWGISAAADADAGETFALKNGWVPLNEDDGKWTLNSIGRAGRYLMAVLTRGHSGYSQTTRAVTEDIARRIVQNDQSGIPRVD